MTKEINRTAGQRASDEVAALLSARNGLLWIVTPEEGRAEAGIREAAARNRMGVKIWDCSAGTVEWKDGKFQSVTLTSSDGRLQTDPFVPLGAIRSVPGLREVESSAAVWIFRDLPIWFRADPGVLRLVRSLARQLPRESVMKTIVVLTTSREIPPDLQDAAVVIEWPLPDREEIANILKTVLGGLPPEMDRKKVLPEMDWEAAVEAAVGLTAEAASTCYAKSLVTQGGRIIPSIVAAEKRAVVSKERGVEWIEPDPRGMAAVGGLGNLKAWLWTRRKAFSEKARAFNLPVPKGILIIGPPGCLHADTPIHDPVDGSVKTVKERYDDGREFHVQAMGGAGPVITVAGAPYKYPPAKMIKFNFSNGKSITVTEGHRFLVAPNVWLTAYEVRERLRAGERVLLLSI